MFFMFSKQAILKTVLLFPAFSFISPQMRATQPPGSEDQVGITSSPPPEAWHNKD